MEVDTNETLKESSAVLPKDSLANLQAPSQTTPITDGESIDSDFRVACSSIL